LNEKKKVKFVLYFYCLAFKQDNIKFDFRLVFSYPYVLCHRHKQTVKNRNLIETNDGYFVTSKTNKILHMKLATKQKELRHFCQKSLQL